MSLKRKITTVYQEHPCVVPSCKFVGVFRNHKSHYKTNILVNDQGDLLDTESEAVKDLPQKKYLHQEFFLKNNYSLKNLPKLPESGADPKQRKLSLNYFKRNSLQDEVREEQVDDPDPLDLDIENNDQVLHAEPEVPESESDDLDYSLAPVPPAVLHDHDYLKQRPREEEHSLQEEVEESEKVENPDHLDLDNENNDQAEPEVPANDVDPSLPPVPPASRVVLTPYNSDDEDEVEKEAEKEMEEVVEKVVNNNSNNKEARVEEVEDKEEEEDMDKKEEQDEEFFLQKFLK